MKEKTISKKIVSIIGIIASATILFLQSRYVLQNFYIASVNPGLKVNNLKLGLELGFMLLFGLISFILTSLTNLINAEKKKLVVRNLSIAATVFASISLILSIVFIAIESATFYPNFVYEGKRGFHYFLYDSKKYVLITLLSMIAIASHFMNFAKQTKERINQAWMYILVIGLLILNSMFLMVTILDAFKSQLYNYNTKAMIIPGVVFGIILYLLCSVHTFLGITQRRVVSNDKLNMNKLRVANITFIAIETVLFVTIISLVFAVIKTLLTQLSISVATLYIQYFMGEFLLVGVITAMALVSQSRFSSDERLVFERNERLAQENELNNSEVFKA